MFLFSLRHKEADNERTVTNERKVPGNILLDRRFCLKLSQTECSVADIVNVGGQGGGGVAGDRIFHFWSVHRVIRVHVYIGHGNSLKLITMFKNWRYT